MLDKRDVTRLDEKKVSLGLILVIMIAMAVAGIPTYIYFQTTSQALNGFAFFFLLIEFLLAVTLYSVLKE